MPYKIVRVDRPFSREADGQQLLSSAYPSDSGDCTHTYRANETTFIDEELERCGYGLCVFKDLNSAIEFVKQMDRDKYKIYECEATGTDRSWWGLHNGRLRVMFNKRMIKRMHNPDCHYRVPTTSWPQGTLMADSVTLIREVNTDDDQ